MFQLSEAEASGMRSQTVIASKRNVRYRPYAFTEHGALMLSSVLKSKRAVDMSIRVVRVFIQLREVLAGNKELATRIEKLELGQRQHASALSAIVTEIRRLMKPPASAAEATDWVRGPTSLEDAITNCDRMRPVR